VTLALGKFGGRPLGIACFAALAALSCSAMIAAAAQSVPEASAPSRGGLDASIAGRVRELTVLARNISRWGCDKPMYATSVEGCRQLNEQARVLAAELQELKARAGEHWTSEKQGTAEASVPQAPPPRPKPYTYRWRTNPNLTYRTICVRLCDGFYYPVSEASPPVNFISDEQKCQSSCSAPTKLFYATRGEDIDQMVALTGEGYAGLPNAFHYRTEYVDACSCKPKPWSAEAKVEYDRRAILAARTLAESIVAAGAGEMAKVLADTSTRIAQGARRDAKAAKVKLSQSAVDKPQLRARYRALRSSGDLPPPPQPEYQPPQRRFFLFGNRY
jgi:hypothetical protein